MNEHDQHTHTAFLQALINQQNPEQYGPLQLQLSEAVSRERCIRRAVFGVTVLGALSIATFAYAMLLVPSFVEKSSPLFGKCLQITTLASVICLAFFLTVWGQIRGQIRSLHRQCHDAIIDSYNDRCVSRSTRIEKIETLHPQEPPNLIRLPKAS